MDEPVSLGSFSGVTVLLLPLVSHGFAKTGVVF
jgi:hypothetical protein